MAKSVIINGATYPNVPYVNIPLAEGSGNAKFVDTDSGNVTAAEMAAGKKAWAGGEEITGTATSRSASDVTLSGATTTVPAGIYTSQIAKTVPPTTYELEVVISGGGGVIGLAQSDYPLTATGAQSVLGDFNPGYLASAPSASSNTYYIQTEEKTVTPTTSAQDIEPSSNKLISGIHVNAVDVSATALAAHVAAGYTFFANDLTRKTGTLVTPTIVQDSATKVLTIS